MKFQLPYFKLAKKLTLLTLGLCLSAIITILTLAYFSMVHLNERILDDEISAKKAFIGRSYVEALWSFDEAQIKEISDSFMNNLGFASMTALKVVDANGNVLFYKSSGPEKKMAFEDYANIPFTKTAVTEVIKNEEVLGRVYFAFTTHEIMLKFRNELSSIFLIAFSILGFLSIGIHVFFNRLLTVPLNLLLDHIKQIRNKNYETKSYCSLPHEMQQISNALNYTSHLIKKRNDDLQINNENLERMVAERTSELESQVVKNLNASRLVSVGEVASGIAHEINNPLTVINGQILKLKRQLKDCEGFNKMEVETSLSKISLMNDRIVKIIKGLKLISRDGQGDPMVDFSLPIMLEYIVLLTEMKIKASNIQFAIEIDPGIDMVYGREVQISQVIVNLVNNSVDAISQRPDKWIKLVITDHNDAVEFRVTDSGKGISTELREKIMQPFFTTKEVGKGTGLGLSISKGIIKDHGGDFYYNENSPNTQFVFSIYKSGKKIMAA